MFKPAQYIQTILGTGWLGVWQAILLGAAVLQTDLGEVNRNNEVAALKAFFPQGRRHLVQCGERIDNGLEAYCTTLCFLPRGRRGKACSTPAQTAIPSAVMQVTCFILDDCLAAVLRLESTRYKSLAHGNNVPETWWITSLCVGFPWK